MTGSELKFFFACNILPIFIQ